MRIIASLFIVVACLFVTSCATGLDERPARAMRACMPGELLVCQEVHDRSSLDRERRVAVYELCGCEKVPF